MKRIYYFSGVLLALCAFAGSVHAQSDITNLVLANAGFDEQWNFNAADEAANLASANGGANIKEVYGWSIISTGDNSAAASYQYGYAGTLNISGSTGGIPSTGYNSSSGGALGISSAWGATNIYGQPLLLPAGSYAIEYAAYNSGPNSADYSKVGWTPDEGDAVLSTKTTFTMNDWDVETIPFEVATATQGKIQVGIGSPNSGSGNVGRIFFDYIKLTCNSIDKTQLEALTAEANTLYNEGATELKPLIDAFNSAQQDEATSQSFINAAISLVNALPLCKMKIELAALYTQATALLTAYNADIYSETAKAALESAVQYSDADLTSQIVVQGYIDRLNVAIITYKASALGLKIQYTFDNVRNDTIANAADTLYNGTLHNQATIIPMGKYNVLSLGTDNGYLDMGEATGYAVVSRDTFTVSAFYRVDETASLSGAGHFLWAFSVLSVNSASAGPYLFYQLNAQTFSLSTGGWNNGNAVSVSTAAEKDTWQHVVYRQTGNKGELYVDGQQVKTSETIPLLSTAFTTPPSYNWIGRPPFNGDSYLKNTLVYDFRLYNQAVEDSQITEWAALVEDLNSEYAYDYEMQGDFSELAALIAECNSLVENKKDIYPEVAVSELENAVGVVQAFVDTTEEATQRQVDAYTADLKAAYDKFLKIHHFEVTVNNSEWGSVAGAESGYISADSLITLVATPASEEYDFVSWSSGSNILGSGDTLRLLFTQDTLIVATFAPKGAELSTVVFEANGGSTVNPISVVQGNPVAKPDPDPTKAGHTFAGWYADEELSIPWDFSTGTVVGDTTLYAKWDELPVHHFEVTVNNSAWGSVEGAESGDIPANSPITLVATPASGCSFVSWSSGGNTLGSSDTLRLLLTQDTLIVATFAGPVTYTVAFNANGGSSVDTASVVQGNTVAKPAPDPTRAGYTFAGWYADKELSILWDFSVGAVVSDTTLYAKWDEQPATSVASDGVSTINLYPNPVANGELNVESGELKSGEKIAIYSMSGSLVGSYEVSGSVTTINISHLASGAYIVKVGRLSVKVLVN